MRVLGLERAYCSYILRQHARVLPGRTSMFAVPLEGMNKFKLVIQIFLTSQLSGHEILYVPQHSVRCDACDIVCETIGAIPEAHPTKRS